MENFIKNRDNRYHHTYHIFKVDDTSKIVVHNFFKLSDMISDDINTSQVFFNFWKENRCVEISKMVFTSSYLWTYVYEFSEALVKSQAQVRMN